MNYCSFDEAFTGPVMPPKLPKKKKVKEGFVPGPLPGSTDPDRMAAPPPPANDVLEGPPSSGPPTDAVKLDELFPLPGETGEVETWQKAFTLEPSRIPSLPRSDGSVSVAGQPTLWRQIPKPVAPVSTPIPSQLAAFPSDINQKLETLTRQLESLTTPTPLQGTAELFLFVAIGLLMLLAIDTLLRFAVAIGKGSGRSKMNGGGWRVRGARGRWV